MEFPLPITLGISHFGERDNFLYSQDGGKSGQDSEARIDPKCGISGHARGEQAWPTRARFSGNRTRMVSLELCIKIALRHSDEELTHLENLGQVWACASVERAYCQRRSHISPTAIIREQGIGARSISGPWDTRSAHHACWLWDTGGWFPGQRVRSGNCIFSFTGQVSPVSSQAFGRD